MYYVYVISSQTKNYIYVGLTDNVKRRIKEHNDGHNKTTKPYRPFKLLLIEKFDTRFGSKEKRKIFEEWNWQRVFESIS
jgi:putative endonuclease